MIIGKLVYNRIAINDVERDSRDLDAKCLYNSRSWFPWKKSDLTKTKYRITWAPSKNYRKLYYLKDRTKLGSADLWSKCSILIFYHSWAIDYEKYLIKQVKLLFYQVLSYTNLLMLILYGSDIDKFFLYDRKAAHSFDHLIVMIK